MAREYGIPCIIGAVGATRNIQFGDKVILNATKGILMKLPDDECDVNGS